MRAFRIPMRIRFRDMNAREGLLIRGPRGWGEYSPFPDYPAYMRARWLAAAREAADAGWPTPLRTRVPVNITVPAVTPEAAHRIVKGSGCTTAKVKVGDDSDEARVEAVRAALGPEGRVRVDANAAWDVDVAARRIKALARYDLEYVEQPVATLEEMAELRRKVAVPLAADESIRLAPDPLGIDLGEAADVAVLKVAPLGGVGAALRVAEAVGVPAVVSSALETSIGIAAGLALAVVLPELPYACGLATIGLLGGDVVADPLVPVNGEIDFRRVEPDEGALAPFEVSGEAARRWLRAAGAEDVPA